MSILIKNVLLGGRARNIYIEGNEIEAISEASKEQVAEFVIDGTDKAAIPGLFNAHTHAAMTLLRGYADDMPLQEWLETKIWPVERKLTEDDVYWGTKLACLEMIKSGTIFFNDMYWHWRGSARAVAECGIRAALSAVFIDGFDEEKAKEQIIRNEALYKESKELPERIIFALGPHAIYTVSESSLCWVRDFAEKHDILVHIHLSETKTEVEDCITRHGMRPVEYLNELDFLCARTIACHCTHLSRNEMELLKKHNVKIVHNPTSNMKLAAGRKQYDELKRLGLYANIALGTDGCASNNNLDMFEEMKMASLLQKAYSGDPTCMPAKEAFGLATGNAARMFRLNAGEIAEGKLADVVLLDLKNVNLVPNHNLISNIVYSANGSCVDTVICDGAILMEERKVKGEEEIKEKAQEVAYEIVKQ
ncbi:MAG: amidohydrolase family protein [Methanophagales archaeon]|nr:amidohydrolase family protein [Methanophagales archaeon]